MFNLLTCLEFLTRSRFTRRTEWHDDDFSQSVPYFPLIGLVIGLFVGGVNYGLVYLGTPLFLRGVLLILAELLIIGSLMYDGYMDTCDGVFSARDRARMLEIMKDSNVGANAAIGVVCLVLLKVAAYISLDPLQLSWALLAMYISTRTFMVNYIINFKYPRKTGIGIMFKQYAKPSYLYIAFGLCLAMLAYIGLPYLYVAAATFVICLGIAHFLSSQLGGLTGDTYGCLTECGHVVFMVLAVYML